MTIEATLTRIAEALETIAANGAFARQFISAKAELLDAQIPSAEGGAPVQAEAEKPKAEKKGGRPPKKDAAPAEPEPSAQDPDTLPLPLVPGDLPIASAATAPAPAETPAPAVADTTKTFTYDEMVAAAHAYAAVGTREVITSILSGLNSSTKLKDVPEALYGQAIDKFNAALAAVNKSADAIGF